MAVAAYRELQPVRRFPVKFASDPGFIHERAPFLPMPFAAGSYVVLTADGDAYEEALGD